MRIIGLLIVSYFFIIACVGLKSDLAISSKKFNEMQELRTFEGKYVFAVCLYTASLKQSGRLKQSLLNDSEKLFKDLSKDGLGYREMQFYLKETSVR